MDSIDIQCKETSMGENKGHSDKNPSYPELDDMGSAASRAGDHAGNQQSGQQDIGDQQSGNLQDNSQHSISQQHSVQASSNKQSIKQGSAQHGGQHASGGTPALDDLNKQQGSSQSGSQGNASQADWNNLEDKDR
jgi:hypothetical protein